MESARLLVKRVVVYVPVQVESNKVTYLFVAVISIVCVCVFFFFTMKLFHVVTSGSKSSF